MKLNNNMNKHLIITIAGILIFHVCPAQDKPMNRLSTSLFTYESIDETINDGIYSTTYFSGLYYQRVISKSWQGAIGINLENKLIDDNCKNCADNFYGMGNFKETELLLGIRNEIELKSCTKIKPLLGVDVSYASSTYSGDFSGGFGGQGYTFDNSYDKLGVAGDAGISFEPFHNLVLTALTSLKFSRIFEERKLEDLKTEYSSLKWTPVEILIGVRF